MKKATKSRTPRFGQVFVEVTRQHYNMAKGNKLTKTPGLRGSRKPGMRKS